MIGVIAKDHIQFKQYQKSHPGSQNAFKYLTDMLVVYADNIDAVVFLPGWREGYTDMDTVNAALNRWKAGRKKLDRRD